MLDVSDALDNIDLQDVFTVLRRREIMNTYGESKLSIEKIPGQQGVVYPEGLNDLSRRPEAQTQAKSIVLYTSFLLRGASETVDGCNYQPDVIYWNGDNFVVVRVEDWSRYFPNFVKVTAESIDIVDKPAPQSAQQPVYNPSPALPSYLPPLPPLLPPGPILSPGGAILKSAVFTGDGTNNVFTLPSLPSGALAWFWNGEIQSVPDDYSAVGKVITMVLTPGNGDHLIALYT